MPVKTVSLSALAVRTNQRLPSDKTARRPLPKLRERAVMGGCDGASSAPLKTFSCILANLFCYPNGLRTSS